MGASKMPQQPAHMHDELDDYTGYRVMYHVEKFIAGWRNLVLFYLAMFIAGYAKVVDVCLFWGAVAALLLIYWEPYLSPKFPWNEKLSGLNQRAILRAVQKWGSQPCWAPRASPTQKESLLQWLYCLGQSLPQRQQLVHRIIQSLILVPCVSMAAGVFRQTVYTPLRDDKATYYSGILLALVVLYTLPTIGVNLAFLWVAKHKLNPEAAAAVGLQDWQPQDMMHFLCKILGQCLNTVVQTLVAGAFVEYMPKAIFWLGAVITSMSYCATNLLYDISLQPPVKDNEVDSHWLTDLTCINGRQTEGVKLGTVTSCNVSVSRFGAPSGSATGGSVSKTLPAHNGHDGVDLDSASCAHGTVFATQKCGVAPNDDDVALAFDCAEGGNFIGSKAAAQSSQSGGCEVHREVLSVQTSNRNGRADSPPFLLYRWPKGVRGWSIIGLLIGQAGPCVIILTMLCWGKHQNKPELYLDQSTSECKDKCRMRYEQLLYALACLGLLTCYYAFTIGFLGCGPVTFVYRNIYHAHRKLVSMSKRHADVSSSTTGADAC